MSWWKAALGLERDGEKLEKKEIIGPDAVSPWTYGNYGQWGAVSRQDGDNFRTNRVTLADYQDRLAASNPTGLAATWACVGLIAGTGASLPCVVNRQANGVTAEATDHPLSYVLRQSPNYDQTPLDFFEFMFASIELQGNAYASIERRADGSVYSLTPIRPDLVTVRRKSNGFLQYEWTDGGQRSVKDVADVLHIRGPMGNALGGISVLSACRGVFYGAISAEFAAGTTFSNGMRPSGVLSTDPSVSLNKEQRQEFDGYLQERFQGSINSGRPLLLDRGMKWQQINITPEDAQMLESRKFSGEEICRIFGVPPAMVGYGDKSSNWGTGKEVDVLGFVKFTLRRRIKRVEQALQKQLLTPADRVSGVTISFNLDALLRADSQGRASFYQSGLQNGWFTINEVRALENMPPVEGGDVPRMQSQNIPITEAAAVPPGGQ